MWQRHAHFLIIFNACIWEQQSKGTIVHVGGEGGGTEESNKKERQCPIPLPSLINHSYCFSLGSGVMKTMLFCHRNTQEIAPMPTRETQPQAAISENLCRKTFAFLGGQRELEEKLQWVLSCKVQKRRIFVASQEEDKSASLHNREMLGLNGTGNSWNLLFQAINKPSKGLVPLIDL